MADLIQQRVIVKVISDRVMLSYECEHEETVSFILSNQQARLLARQLKAAADSDGAYTATVPISRGA